MSNSWNDRFLAKEYVYGKEAQRISRRGGTAVT